uniref:phage tail protein n=1 Tax=Roseivirga sp. TaxID=1964215 RepID=UPI00404759EA
MSRRTKILIMTSIPMSTIVAFMLDKKNIPLGWLLCDGKPIPSEYTNLIAALGLNNTPDLSARTIIGTGAPNGKVQSDGRKSNFASAILDFPLGYTGGEYMHNLTIDEMPSHSHTVPSSQQHVNGTTQEGGGRFDYYPAPQTTSSVGKGYGHLNMQPYMAINYIIYTGQDN